jgi:hypothetical protein
MEFSKGKPRRSLTFGRVAVCFFVFLAAALLAHITPLCAEDGKTVKVCIPQHTASNALLHQVATILSSHKPDKASHTRVQGAELLGLDEILYTDNVFNGSYAKQTLSTEALDRARQEQCGYLLVISLPDVETARSPQPNVWAPNQQATTSTPDPYMRKQDPEYYVRVKYRLYRLDATVSTTDGFVTTHDAAPANAVVAAALDMLANQVFTKITK